MTDADLKEVQEFYKDKFPNSPVVPKDYVAFLFSQTTEFKLWRLKKSWKQLITVIKNKFI